MADPISLKETDYCIKARNNAKTLILLVITELTNIIR